MRTLYSTLFYLALPIIALRLYARARKQPAYRDRIRERFGFYPVQFEDSIWVHAVSVGEVIAAIPLIKHLQALHPNLPIVVTTMTPTGAERVQASFGDTVTHLYLPYDVPAAVRRFLKAINPRVGIIIETEVWPNLVMECAARQIPLCLMNARLSEKSARGYARLQLFSRMLFKKFDLIAAVGAEDAKRFVRLGAKEKNVVVTGNLKFDLSLPENIAEQTAELKNKFAAHPFIWVAASTHDGEEEIILKAHEKILAVNPHALLILVPRHVDRFDVIAEMVQKNFKLARHSGQEMNTCNVYLGDTIGDLLLFYSLADVAFVGGSLIPRGGHNILEPAVLAKPILTGPHMMNFAEIHNMFLQHQAVTEVKDAQSLAEAVIFYMQHPDASAAQGQKALGVIEQNRGALGKQIAELERFI